MTKYTLGVDYGTDSVRTLLVDASNGNEISHSVFHYPRWKAGKYCDPANNRFRQHPLDYLEGLEKTIRDVIQKAPAGTAQNVVAISVDTTGSTPVAVDKNGTPLALNPEFAENPNAMFVLWKDHTATAEAAEINAVARSWGGVDFTKFEGGIYSSEWFWAKILHVLREDAAVCKAAYSWVEHCDWIPALLTGNTDPLKIKRSRCAAGHKAMWHAEFDGLPAEDFLQKLDPLLAGLRSRLYKETFTCEVKAGNLSPEWAKRLGLNENVAVGVGSFDAHIGALGGEIKPYYLSKIMGTSTCDILIAPSEEVGNKFVKGICGQVDGSVLPGMLGLEAGQSAFGDVYAWFKNLLLGPAEQLINRSSKLDANTKAALVEELADSMIPWLTLEAERIAIGETGIVALDWLNGRRTPDANQLLKGAIFGLNLGSEAPGIFRALVEATAFGSKKIIDRFAEEGIPIEGIIALGGVAKKSPFVMQVVADVINKPILVARSEQACALGSAMAAAVVGGIYPTITDAQQAMGNGFETEYKPNTINALKYKNLYDQYSRMGELVEKETMKK
ncbi:MAG: ribulokinase [Prolixibacteraceae bacterium]|jgi:L-ribulokinase|nr:ribulokinase [Prolixibacteraceae bacterium]